MVMEENPSGSRTTESDVSAAADERLPPGDGNRAGTRNGSATDENAAPPSRQTTSGGDGLDPALIERLTKRPRKRRHHFGLFGPMGVGKTTYLAALYLALDRNGYLNHDLTDADSNAFLDWFVRHLHSGQLLPATQQSWEIALGITRERRDQKVALRDIPGGWFTEEADWEDKLRDIERQLHQCRGSIFFIDAGMILNSAPDSPERRFINRVIDRAIRRTQKGVAATVTGVRPPVAICFSKADLLTREHAPEALNAEDEPTLLKQKADYLWGQLGRFDTVFREGQYHHAAYFALSALGGDVAPNEETPLTPQGVEEPFWFVLEATRNVQRTRRNRMLAGSAVLLLLAAAVLTVLGYLFYQREAVPAYEALLAELEEANVSDEEKLEATLEYLESWQRKRPYTLFLVNDELVEVRGLRDEIAERIAREQFEALSNRADEPAEAARQGAADYAELLADLRAYRSRFPNAYRGRIEQWLHVYRGKHELAKAREGLLAGSDSLEEELDLFRRIESVADRYPALAEEVERAKQQVRRIHDERNYRALREQLGTTEPPGRRLELINRYLDTQPGETYREAARELRSEEITRIQRRYRRALRERIEEEQPEGASAWRLEAMHVLEEFNLDYGALDPQLGRYFTEQRRELESSYASQALDELYERFEQQQLELAQRRDLLRGWLREHLGHERETEVMRRIDQLRQREVERRYAELVDRASEVESREDLLRFLERLRDYRDANPEQDPDPSYEELERRARLNWPQKVLGELIDASRRPQNWDDATRSLEYAQRLEQALEPFTTHRLEDVQALVEQAREHVDELRFRAKQLDWRALRERYLSLFSSGLRGERGRNRIDEVHQLAEAFLATHDPTVSPEGRKTVKQVRDFLEWVGQSRTYTLTIRHADFSEGGTHNAAVAFDHSRDGEDWDRRKETRRIKEEYPSYDESFTVRWAAFDWCHVLGLWHGMFNRRGIFYRNTQRGFLSLLDVTDRRLPNQRDDSPSNWVYIELDWPRAAPEPIRELPRDLPRPDAED